MRVIILALLSYITFGLSPAALRNKNLNEELKQKNKLLKQALRELGEEKAVGFAWSCPSANGVCRTTCESKEVTYGPLGCGQGFQCCMVEEAAVGFRDWITTCTKEMKAVGCYNGFDRAVGHICYCDHDERDWGFDEYVETEVGSNECRWCDCIHWDGSNYSQCSPIKNQEAGTYHTVKCKEDGVTPMPRHWTHHGEECAKYSGGMCHANQITYDGYCYGTMDYLTESALQDTKGRDQSNRFMSVPKNCVVAPVDRDVIKNVVQLNPFATRMVVFADGTGYGTSMADDPPVGGFGPGLKYNGASHSFIQKRGSQYATSIGHAKVFLKCH